MDSIEHPGWQVTCHPMPHGAHTGEFLEDLKKQYRDVEVKAMLSYYDSGFDPLTCPAAMLYNRGLQPEPTFGFEVVWKHSECT